MCWEFYHPIFLTGSTCNNSTPVFILLGISGQEPSAGISTQCLGCLCEAATNCNRTLTCRGDICGLFSITWAYWVDAGKPTQATESADAPNAFTNCVNEPFCAARAVQGYMAKHGKVTKCIITDYFYSIAALFH